MPQFPRIHICHSPEKKKEEKKFPRRAHSSASFSLPPLCFARRAARVRRRRPTPQRAGHPRQPCRARPPLALILPRRHRGPILPCSPRTLAPNPHCHHRPELRRHRGSSSSVSPSSILRGGSISYPSSTRSPPYLAPSPPLQGRRRAGPPAAAPAHRAAPLLPLLAYATAGAARRHHLVPMRTFPSPLWPCLAARGGRAPGRVKAFGLALTRPGWAAGPWAPPVGLRPALRGTPSVLGSCVCAANVQNV